MTGTDDATAAIDSLSVDYAKGVDKQEQNEDDLKDAQNALDEEREGLEKAKATGNAEEVESAKQCVELAEKRVIELANAIAGANKYKDSIKLIEMVDCDSISVCVYIENDGLFALGKRIHAKHEFAEMYGYNWDAVIKHYVGKVDPELMKDVRTDPEAGMFAAYMKGCSPENLEKMKRFESHVRAMLSDDEEFLSFVEENCDSIEWD
jgi:hypothetical protein